MKLINKLLLATTIFISSTYCAKSPVYISHIVNNSSCDFYLNNTNTMIGSGETVTLEKNIDLEKSTLVLTPDNLPEKQIRIYQHRTSDIAQIRSTLTSCIIEKTKAYPHSALPQEVICQRGNNIIELFDYDPHATGSLTSFLVKLYPETALHEKKIPTRYGDASTIYQSPFSATGTCRKTETELLVPSFTESGTICSETYESTNFPNKDTTVDRPYLVYLPYGYFDDPNKLYPVLYHLHGTPSNPEEAVDRVATLLDFMIADKRIAPMIVVFPNGNAPVDQFMNVPVGDLPDFYKNAIVVDDDTIPSFWANSTQLGNMEDDIIFTLCNHIDETYQTKRDKQFRGINGFSGGGGAHQLVLPHSDRFGSVSSNSGYGLDWGTELTIIQDYDEVYSQIFYDYAYTDTHLRDVDPFDQNNYVFANLLPWLYAMANALSPNAAAPYNAYFPIDSDGNIDAGIQTDYRAHSAVYRAALYADDIKANNLKIYFDAGALDFFYNSPGVGYYLLIDVNAIGASYYNGLAHNYSDALTTQGIKHEFVSFRGNHNGQSNIQTMSALLFHSAVFSSDYTSDAERISFVGNGTVQLEENSSMLINQETTVGIETIATYTSVTDFTLNINDYAKLQLGNPGQRGGVLQVGNTHDKFDIETNPALASHTVALSMHLDGAGAELQINNHGILGLGAGVEGQEGITPNYFVMKSLSNVSSITIDIQEGTLKHNQILPGHNEHAALLAIGSCDAYNLTYDEYNSSILGGGNIIKLDDADLTHPALSTGRFNQEVGEKIDFETDHVDGSFSGPVPQGMREYQQESSSLEVLFAISEPVSLNGAAFDSLFVIPPLTMTTYASHAHKNNLDVNVLSSKPLLRDTNKTVLTADATQDELYTFLKLDEYLTLRRKRAPFGKNNLNETTLVYINDVEDLQDNDLIVRVTERDFPPLKEGIVSGQNIGAIGIILNREDPRRLVQVYDLEENW